MFWHNGIHLIRRYFALSFLPYCYCSMNFIEETREGYSALTITQAEIQRVSFIIELSFLFRQSCT